MLDLKQILNNTSEIKEALEKRGTIFSFIEELPKLDKKRKEIIKEVEKLKELRNKSSKEIGQLKKENKDATELIKTIENNKEKVKQLDKELELIDTKIKQILLSIPNIPDKSVPFGKGEEDNVEIKRHLDITKFDFKPKPHWELGTDLDIIDFENATKLAGTRFSLYKGLGAKLERSLMNFFLDQHLKKGYKELLIPVLVNEKALIGTGQLPKFKEDLFKLEDSKYYLIPTAEVTITNYNSNKILDLNTPLQYTGYSLCFRSEAGSAGRDTRGIIRKHQFSKVELVKITNQEDSFKELENLTKDAENLLELLELPYRRIELCTKDLGFSSCKTYDLEVYLPSYNDYKEISSCSNFLDFQSRRANIKYKDNNNNKKYAHTINGSALAIDRCIAAILENYQQKDGSIKVPKVLVPYMGVEYIKKEN